MYPNAQAGVLRQEEEVPGGYDRGGGGPPLQPGALHPGEVRWYRQDREQEEAGHDRRARTPGIRQRSRQNLEEVTGNEMA